MRPCGFSPLAGARRQKRARPARPRERIELYSRKGAPCTSVPAPRSSSAVAARSRKLASTPSASAWPLVARISAAPPSSRSSSGASDVVPPPAATSSRTSRSVGGGRWAASAARPSAASRRASRRGAAVRRRARRGAARRAAPSRAPRPARTGSAAAAPTRRRRRGEEARRVGAQLEDAARRAKLERAPRREQVRLVRRQPLARDRRAVRRAEVAHDDRARRRHGERRVLAGDRGVREHDVGEARGRPTLYTPGADAERLDERAALHRLVEHGCAFCRAQRFAGAASRMRRDRARWSRDEPGAGEPLRCSVDIARTLTLMKYLCARKPRGAAREELLLCVRPKDLDADSASDVRKSGMSGVQSSTKLKQAWLRTRPLRIFYGTLQSPETASPPGPASPATCGFVAAEPAHLVVGERPAEEVASRAGGRGWPTLGSRGSPAAPAT